MTDEAHKSESSAPTDGALSQPESVEQTRAMSRVSVSDRALAASALGVAIIAVIGLIVAIISGGHEDLTRIALTLAIIAFLLQVAFFVTQLWVAVQQDRRSADLFAKTSHALAEIETRTDATVDIIKEQFRFVLEHALGGSQAVTAELTDGTDLRGDETVSDEHEPTMGEIAARLEDLTQATRASAVPRLLLDRWDAIGRQQRGPISADAQRVNRFVRQLSTWPGEAAGRAAITLRQGLSDEARNALDSIARQRLHALEESDAPLDSVPIQITDEAAKELREKGLATLTPRGDGEFSGTLSGAGREVARLKTARGKPPEWLTSLDSSG